MICPNVEYNNVKAAKEQGIQKKSVYLKVITEPIQGNLFGLDYLKAKAETRDCFGVLPFCFTLQRLKHMYLN